MNESAFSEHWAQAQFCYFRAEAARSPALKHLWIQLAQDWIALSENLILQPANDDHPGEPLEQLEPFLVA